MVGTSLPVDGSCDRELEAKGIADILDTGFRSTIFSRSNMGAAMEHCAKVPV